MRRLLVHYLTGHEMGAQNHVKRPSIQGELRGYALQKLPGLFGKRELVLDTLNQVFASQWLAERQASGR